MEINVQFPGLPAANLALGNRPNPRNSQIHANMHDTNNPEDFCIVGAVVAEDNGKDDTSKVTRGASNAGYDA
jgi:hypothetical protein